MDELKEMVSKRLTELLKKQDFSQAALAERSGVSKDTISKAINKGTLSVKVAKLISKATGVSLDYLYGNSDVFDIHQYSLDIIEKHISAFNRTSGYGNEAQIATISLSEPLSQYLEAICNAEKAPESVREHWLHIAKEEFLQSIEKDAEQKTKYALIKHMFLTDEVLEQLAVARKTVHEA